MSQATNPSDSKRPGTLNQEYLAKHGISYQPNLGAKSDLPEHVAYLKSALLDFDGTIPHRLDIRDDILDEVLDERSFQLDDAFRRLNSNGTELAAIRDSLKRYEEVREAAQLLMDQANASEYNWQKLYGERFFRPLEASVKPCDTDTRRVAREKFYYQSFESAPTRSWSLFRGSRPTSQGEAKLSEPVPDYTAYFKVFNTDNNLPTEMPTKPSVARQSHQTKFKVFNINNDDNGIPNKEPARPAMVSYDRWPWEESPRRGLVRSFSSVVLEHLALYGLEPCAANSSRVNAGTRSMKQTSEYMCFPWLVVEHKAADKNIEDCCCQAANGAHAALTMLRNLAKYANRGAPRLTHIPPVTSITTIGAEVKVWVAYATDLKGSCKMTSIWSGSIARIIDIIKLEAILENLLTYAINELRPLISSYIEQWLDLFPIDGSPPHTISETPFAELRSAQNPELKFKTVTDPQTPQPDPSQRTAASGASFNKDYQTFDSSSISFRFTPPRASDAKDAHGKGVRDGHAAAQRSERTKLGPRSAKSSAPQFDSSSSSTSGFGSKVPAFDSAHAPTFGGFGASASGFGSKPSTSAFGSLAPPIFFESAPSIFGPNSKSPAPQFGSSPLAESVDGNDAKGLDYGTSRLVPPMPPGGRGRRINRRVKSQEGLFSDAKADSQRSHSQGRVKRMQGPTINGRF